ncbi:MAG: hypothetical protein M3024_00970 [Candidatus Dormibacteraeota bacterium]|nr:hypothetical protein [Candidatus Dormibacteraeota bacterium]
MAARSDLARSVLALAVRGLPPECEGWGAAMLAELDQVQGRGARWRFALGCARVAILTLRARGDHRPLIRALVVVGLAAAGWIALYNLLSGLVLTGHSPPWGSLFLAFVITTGLGAYAWLVGSLAWTWRPGPVPARRLGSAAGILVGFLWVVAASLWIAGSIPTLSAPPLQWPAALAALAVPGLVSGLGARSSRSVRFGLDIGLWAGAVGAGTFATGAIFVAHVPLAIAPDLRGLDSSLQLDALVAPIVGLAFIPLLCTVSACIGAELGVPLRRRSAFDSWSGFPAGPILALAVAAFATAALTGPPLIAELGYYPAIEAAGRAGAQLDAGASPQFVTTGATIDLTASTGTWLTVFDRAGRPVAGSVALKGSPVVFPAGVLTRPDENSQDIDFVSMNGDSVLHGKWYVNHDQSTDRQVAIGRWRDGFVVAGNSPAPRFDVVAFGLVLLLMVAVMMKLIGRTTAS